MMSEMPVVVWESRLRFAQQLLLPHFFQLVNFLVLVAINAEHTSQVLNDIFDNSGLKLSGLFLHVHS